MLAASVVLNATPGQDLMLVMSRSVTQGQAAGVATGLGVSAGLLVHSVPAALGLGIVLKTSEWLFFVMKIVGAAYLVYLGIQALRSASAKLARTGAESRSLRKSSWTVPSATFANPKIAIFYLAWLYRTSGMVIMGLSVKLALERRA